MGVIEYKLKMSSIGIMFNKIIPIFNIIERIDSDVYKQK